MNTTSSMSKKGYHKVAQDIETMILRGDLPRGGLVPAERQLADRLSASLGEVRLAVNKLAKDGKLIRIARKGTFVSSEIQVESPNTSSFNGQTWAVLVPTMEYSYPSIIHAIEEEAREWNIRLVVHCFGRSWDRNNRMFCGNLKDDIEREQNLVRQSVEEGVQGILLAPALLAHETRDPKTLDYLMDLSIPVVLFDHTGINNNTLGVDCVLKDDFSGCYESTSHMIQHGYKKIALFEGWSPEKKGLAHEILQRTRGYEMAMADHGVTKMPLPSLRNWDIDHNPEAVRKYLNAGVEAFVLMDDDGAACLLRLLNRWGIKVPEQVAIIGFDDDRICELTNPPLSSVRAPIGDMARWSVRLLRERIVSREKGNYRSIVLKPRVIARASCGRRCSLANHPITSLAQVTDASVK